MIPSRKTALNTPLWSFYGEPHISYQNYGWAGPKSNHNPRGEFIKSCHKNAPLPSMSNQHGERLACLGSSVEGIECYLCNLITCTRGKMINSITWAILGFRSKFMTLDPAGGKVAFQPGRADFSMLSMMWNHIRQTALIRGSYLDATALEM